LFVVLVIISSFLNTPAYTQESEDSQIFISGFNAYQQKDYTTTIARMNEVLQKYPDSPLRDMVLFWLSRAYYKNGNQRDAARYLSQFSREYPDNPLKGTVDEELLALTARYEKGEQLPTGTLPVAAQKAVPEKERLSVTRVEQEKLARQQAEQERLAAVQREQERMAAVKAEEARAAAEKSAIAKRTAADAEQARLAAIQKEQERAATLNAEAERKAAEKAEQERLAALKAEEDRRLAAKAEQQKAESEKIDMEQVARQQAEMVRLTMAKAEQKRLAAQKAEEEREAAAKAAKARQNLIAASTAEEERRAAAQKEQERVAALRSEKERQAASAAEASRQDAAKQEQAPPAAVKLGQSPQRDAAKNARASSKAVLREKAIAQYKTIIEKYPKSKAAASAAAKLKELGVAVAVPQAAAAEQLPENSQTLRFEVAPFAGLEFSLSSKPQAYPVSRRISIPFEVTNRGNGDDSFYLESGFPAENAAAFAAASQPGQAVNQTTILAPGEVFKGVITLVIPPTSIDGLRISYPVKASSRLLPEATQSREITLTASAPLLRGVVKTDKAQLAPGEKAVYRVSVLNVGSTTAEGVTLRLNFPPQLESVDYAAAGFKQEMKSTLILDGVQVKSGESKEFKLTFQLKDDSLAGQELLVHAELVNLPLKTSAVFVSNAAYVQQQFGVQVQGPSGRQVVIPGQQLFVPFVVSNTGNVREKFRISAAVKGAQDAVIFQDLNRDGVRQPNEPIVTELGPLAPKEEAGIVMEIQTPRNAADGSQGSAQIVVSSEGNVSRSSSGTVQFVYSRPVLQMAMTAPEGRLKPGQVASFDLTITNRGSNLARVVELQGSWPDQLELIAAEPAVNSAGTGSILWKFNELGAGEKRIIKVSFRVRSGIGVGTSIQVKNLLSYEDQLGNRY
jgi:hypothetical protein